METDSLPFWGIHYQRRSRLGLETDCLSEDLLLKVGEKKVRNDRLSGEFATEGGEQRVGSRRYSLPKERENFFAYYFLK